MPVLILTAINLDDLENKIPDQDITGLVCSKQYSQRWGQFLQGNKSWFTVIIEKSLQGDEKWKMKYSINDHSDPLL